MIINGVSTLERAYQLARSGQYRTLTELKAQVRAEGYYDAVAQLEGRSLAASLRKLMDAAKQPS